MNLHEKRAAAIKAARAIVDGAKADGNRELTPEEATEVETHLAEVKTLDGQIAGKALVDSVTALGSVDDEPAKPDVATPAKTLGEHYAKTVDLDALTRLKSVSGSTVSTPEFIPGKAATDPQITTGAIYTPYLTQYDRTIVHGNRPGLVVADLLSAGTIGPNTNAISYFVEGAVEGAFTTVAEGGAKPQIHIADPTARVDALKKIAAWFDATDEMVTDLDWMMSEINNRGLYLLSVLEETQLMSGLGTGSTILGLLNRAGIQTETAAGTAVDNAPALFRAATKVQTGTGLAADALVIHPTDYQTLRLQKDANNQFYGGGFFSGQYGIGGVPGVQQPGIWGLNTVITTATAVGTAVVMNGKAAATVYRKGGVRVESTNSDASKFVSNIVTTRIEERIALAVRLPAAIVKVTLL